MARKVLIGTTNPSKLQRFSSMLEGYGFTFLTLRDLGITEEPEETGQTPEENAVIKAKFYGKYFDSVICNDSGLYFSELDRKDPRQPGLKVRSPQGRRLDDEEMIRYYADLVHSLGGRVLAYYLDGVAVYHKGRISSFMDSEEKETMAVGSFYMTEQAAQKRHPGWPLDSLSLNRKNLTYFIDAGSEYEEKEQIILGNYRKRMIAFLLEALKDTEQ